MRNALNIRVGDIAIEKINNKLRSEAPALSIQETMTGPRPGLQMFKCSNDMGLSIFWPMGPTERKALIRFS